MIDISLLMEVAEECNPQLDDAAIRHISALAKKQQKLERDVERRERLLKATEAKLARVSELELPDAMAAVGMANFELDNGYKVSVKKEYYATLPSPDSKKPELLERRTKLFSWLRANRSGDIIKQQIVVDAGRGEEAKAARVMSGLDKAGIEYKNTETIAHQTLAAFVKEQMEKVRAPEDTTPPFPTELFGVHVKRVASLKPAKRK